jgi:hypothetical protein
VTPLFTGELVDPQGRALAGSLVAAPSGLLLEGEKIAEAPVTGLEPGSALWRTSSPLRLRQRVEGLNPNNDFDGLIRVSVFRCRPGSLELTLIGKSGGPIRVRVDGVPLTTIRPEPDTLWQGGIAAPPYADGGSRCVYELESDGLVGSTRIEFVPAG